MDEAFLILDIAESDNWTSGPYTLHRIPPEKRPTVLQCSRQVAEQEALRLQGLHPLGRFVVFEAVKVTVSIDAPTHVNINGKVMETRRIARLAEVHDGVPF